MHEKRLLNNLLATYNTLERPVANESDPLVVKFGLTLQQIIDVVSVDFQRRRLPIQPLVERPRCDAPLAHIESVGEEEAEQLPDSRAVFDKSVCQCPLRDPGD